MATNRDLLLNGLNQIINSLVSGSQPDKDPGSTAWAWLTASSGSEPSQVNTYIQGQFSGSTVSASSTAPSKNWACWSSAMNTAFSSATGDVAKWLDTAYVPMAADLPTVPPDVITWTKANMPINAVDVVVIRGAPLRTGV